MHGLHCCASRPPAHHRAVPRVVAAAAAVVAAEVAEAEHSKQLQREGSGLAVEVVEVAHTLATQLQPAAAEGVEGRRG